MTDDLAPTAVRTAPINLLAYMRAAFVAGVMVGVVLGYGLSVWGLR